MTNQREAKQKEKETPTYITIMQEFGHDSQNFFNKCAKPDRAGKPPHPS
jgi:hypothetical protein